MNNHQSGPYNFVSQMEISQPSTFQVPCCLILTKAQKHNKLRRNYLEWWGPANEGLEPSRNATSHQESEGSRAGSSQSVN